MDIDKDFWPTHVPLQDNMWSGYWESIKEFTEDVSDFVQSEKFLRGLAIGAGAVVIVGTITTQQFFTSVPDGLYPVDRWKIRKIHARTQFCGLLAKIGSKFGFGKPFVLNRRLRTCFDYSVRDKVNVNVYSDKLQFDGVSVVLYRKYLWNLETHAEDHSDQRPALIHIYGGGWSFGSAEMYEPHHRLLTEKLDAAVLTVEYRKAPENAFPVPFDDCYNAVKYFCDHAEEFSVDRNRISILGDSAGANLAAAVVLKLRDEGMGQAMKTQLLISPCTQFMNFRTNSYLCDYPLLSGKLMPMVAALYAGENPSKIGSGLLQNYHISQALIRHPAWQFLKKYVSQPVTVFDSVANEYRSFQQKALNPYLCPLMTDRMRDLPPTLIMICQFDILKDDGLAYLDRLQSDGVKVGLKVYPGTHSTFRYFEELKVGKEMMHDVIDYFRANM